MRRISAVFIGVLSVVLLVTLIAPVVAQDDAATDTEIDERPFIGITFRVNSAEQVVIWQVGRGTPAYDAGLKARDIITAIDDQDVDGETLTETINAYKPGDTITLHILRGDETLEIDVTLAEYPTHPTLRTERIREVLPIQPGGLFGAQIEHTNEGLVILEVAPGSPAEDVGLMPEDVITAINGESLGAGRALPAILHTLRGEDTLTMSVQRGDETLEIEVPLDALMLLGRSPFGETMPFETLRPRLQDLRETLRETRRVAPAWFGVRVLELNAQIAETRGLPVTEGAYVIDIETRSPADVAGVQPEDIIQAINGAPVDAENSLTRQMGAYTAGETITLGILRDGESLEIAITLEPMPSARKP